MRPPPTPPSLNLWRRLEMFKFGVYIAIPIATVFYFNVPSNLEKFINSVGAPLSDLA